MFLVDIGNCYNLHFLGRGIPNVLSDRNNRASQTHFSAVPTLDEAISAFRSSGGHLSNPSTFGTDPLAGHQNLQRENIPTPNELFSFVVNGIDRPFAESLQFTIQQSLLLQSQI